MRSIDAAVLAALLFGSPAEATELRETFAGHWTLQDGEKGADSFSTQASRGVLTVSGKPELQVTISCTNWQSWAGASGGLCSFTDASGDAYWVEYGCERSAGWPPPPSCRDGFWRTTTCGQSLPDKAGLSLRLRR